MGDRGIGGRSILAGERQQGRRPELAPCSLLEEREREKLARRERHGRKKIRQKEWSIMGGSHV
jgi:hypothetical protein